jgi:hypothetical protein
MQRLLNPNIVPPDGFKYRHPETGYWSVAETHDDWLRRAYDHLKGNGLPVPPNLRQVMEEQLCAILPSGWCDEFDPNRVEPITRLHRGDIIEGMEVFLRWGLQKKPTVDQKEAERRAEICANCYLNVQVQGCSSCYQVAEELTKRFHTSRDDKLAACGVCKCWLKSKVHFPLGILESIDSEWKQQNYPDFCWLKRGGKNYDNQKTLPD